MTTIVNIIPSEFSWQLYRMPYPLNFYVYKTVIDNISFYRPFEIIHKYEFEDFFHFGEHCSGYDHDRVVIKNSQKPSYKPTIRVQVTKDGFWKLL